MKPLVSTMPDVTRRALLGGGLALGFGLAVPGKVAHAQTGDDSDQALPGSGAVFQPDAFIRIGTDGSVVLVLPSVEMGQGIHTGLATLIAETLGCDLPQVHAYDAPPNVALYANPMLGGMQATGGSTSTRAFWATMQEAGAIARTMLATVAAVRWGVPVEQCSAAGGQIVHAASGRSLPFGALAAAAATLPVPATAPTVPNAPYRLIGKALPRLDTPAKSNGSAVYGIDVQLPGMKVGTVAACPIFGGKLRSCDDSVARTMPGFVAVLRLPDAVAVVADTYWNALQALGALVIAWDAGPNAAVDTRSIFDSMVDAAKAGAGLSALELGRVDDAFSNAHTTLEAEYFSPFLAHATMEPINCTVHVQPSSCDIWVGTQVPVEAQSIGARLTGLPKDQVRVHNHYIGGGFGRRLFAESIEQAVGLAKQVPYPLKLIWSREEDLSHDRYRPGYYDRMGAALTADGKVAGWRQHITTGSVSNVFVPGGLPDGKMDPDVPEGAAETAYDFPAHRVNWTRHTPPVPIGWWRGVGPAHNCFVIESFMDECAHKLGVDPVVFRRTMIQRKTRARTVLDLAAQKSGWDSDLPKRHGRGIAVSTAFGSFLAAVLEVEVDANGDFATPRAVVAVDVGQMVNPNTVAAQVEGGFIFGLTAALYGGIEFAAGATVQKNFDTYRILRMNDAPRVEVYLVKSTEAPGGIGEAGTVLGIATLGNALFSATGTRIRQLPVDRRHLAEKH